MYKVFKFIPKIYVKVLKTECVKNIIVFDWWFQFYISLKSKTKTETKQS